MESSIVRREPDGSVLGDEEIRLLFRTAEAFALSKAWKDLNAEQAFAKIVVGRGLGLNPAQAMQGIHLVKGNVQIAYPMLGQFVRTRDGYDYHTGWLKEEPRIDFPGDVQPPALVAVWHEEEDPADDRSIVGAFAVITVDGTRRGISRYTLDDAKQAGLIKDGGAWKTVPRNMLLARALSNAVKWFAPEVLSGLPVYVEGEIPEPASITAPAGSGDDEGTGVDLGPRVEKVIARATALGHAGLSNRAAIEIALGGRAPSLVSDWVKNANAELTRFAAEKAETGTATENVDAEPVVEPEAEAPVEEEPADAEEVTPAPPASDDAQHALIQQARLDRLIAMRDEEKTPREAEDLEAEIAMIEAQLEGNA